MLPDWIKNFYLALITPVINFFIKKRLNPNHFTTLGLLLSIPTAYLFAIGYHRIAGAIMLLGGTFDIIDGRVARATNRTTKFGALYDSTLDRYSEVMIFFGLIYYFIVDWNHHASLISLITAVAVAVAIGGGVMTSYVRARAEGLGLDCKVGVMQRAERVVFIAFGAIFHLKTLVIAIIIVAIFSNITAIQRLLYVWKNERRKSEVSVPQK
ncbi:MAG: CDP-alcohol phosphatidyltransferase family protein [Calditrichaeota bacterium]|nr:CDP-alcohol phosphatidyltransferase family protein [Calditrichota bacterium]